MSYRGKKRFHSDFDSQKKKTRINVPSNGPSNAYGNQAKDSNSKDGDKFQPRRNNDRFNRRGRGKRGGFSGQQRDSNQRPKREFSAAHVQYFKEAEVGIEEYVGAPWEGTQMIFKHRFNDFVVNEVDSSGKILRVSDLAIPKLGKTDNTSLDMGEKLADGKAKLLPILGEAITAEVLDFIEQQLKIKSQTQDAKREEGSGEMENKIDEIIKSMKKEVVINKEISKEERTLFYDILKSNFKDVVTGSTVNGKITLTQKNSRRENRREDGFSGAEKFLYFNLMKVNRDTISTLNEIANILDISSKRMAVAGTKDKRGITTQRCSVFKIEAGRLARINRFAHNLMVGDFEYNKEPLRLGDLTGNRFEIILRKADKSKKVEIEAALGTISELGFINYFGLQRFGSAPVGSHNIGLQILKQEWDTAVDLIMSPISGDSEEAKEGKKIWKESRNAEAALQKLPRYLVAERAILNDFARNTGVYNSSNAFARVPRNLRLMYVHAYQSYIWNKAASERARKYGVENVVIGDVVLKKGSTRPEEKDKENKAEEAEAGNDTEFEDEELVSGLEYNPSEFTEYSRCEVEHITFDNISSYTIYDVVLPTFGSDVKYPTNEVKVIYDDILKKDNIDPIALKSHPKKDYRMFGNYRPLITKPLDLSFEWIEYSNDDEDLSAGFVERKLAITDNYRKKALEKRQPQNAENRDSVLSEAATEANSQNPANSEKNTNQLESTYEAQVMETGLDSNHSDVVAFTSTEKFVDSVPENSEPSGTKPAESLVEPPQKNLLALKLCFTLPQSTYATMLLRELSRHDTASGYHSILSNTSENPEKPL